MNKITLLLCLIFLLFAPSLAKATHLYSGYISYTADLQNPRKFDFVFTLYTYNSSQADDPFVLVDMGDGNTVTIQRAGVTQYSKHYDKETFTWSYTYAASGNYTVQWTGEGRNGGIINMAAPSDLLSFKVITHVKVGTLTQNLNGAKLAGAPITVAYTGEPWTHNLLAYDEDGDYLVYELVTPKYRSPTVEIADIPGYWLPEGLTVSEFGEIHWPNPDQKGQYGIAVKVTEMRNGREIGSMIVDMTFVVTERTDQPKISLLNKDRLTVNEDGSIQTWPGQPVKLEFYLQKNPDSDLPLNARQFGEMDTLKLEETSLAFRDTVNGFALTYTFTPTAALERTEPYLIGMRGRPIDDKPQYQQTLRVEHDWAFAYFYVGEQRRPLSSPKEPIVTIVKVYPNPVIDDFVVEAPNLPDLSLVLRNISGQVVAGYTLKPGRNTLSRPAGLAGGLYFYTLISGSDLISSGKLVLQ